MKTTNDVVFTPSVEEFEHARTGRPLTIICGLNNCGKSLLLKNIKSKKGKLAYLMGVNRFYHAFHIQPRQIPENELDQFDSTFRQSFNNVQANQEQNFINLESLISGLKDEQRTKLFELCSLLLGNQLTLKKEDDDNELSFRYIDMDGYNVSVGSTGTRLLLTILGTCLDKRFSTMLIDEPELGLGPKIQNALSSFLQDQSERQKYFPHLKQIFLATHSNLFLSRSNITDNFWISKTGNSVNVEPIKSIQEFHRLQFNLIGNDLETIFLPSAIVLAEGKTDFQYLDRVIGMHLPSRKITVVDVTGDPKRKVHNLREVFGDLSASPFQSRLFVVLDSVHNQSLKAELTSLGVKETNIIVWTKNGIEYLYPSAIMAEIFHCAPDAAHDISISDDIVSLNGIEKKKNDLCKEVLTKLNGTTEYPAELQEKLLIPLLQSVS